MRPDEKVLSVPGKEGEVNLVGIGDVEIAVIGVTPGVVLSAQRLSASITHVRILTVHVPEKGHAGLLAVRLDFCGRRENADFILRVANVDGQTKVDLRNPWCPVASRMGQVVASDVHVVIDNVVFTTSTATNDKFETRFVRFGYSLLLQYLNNEIPAQAVIDAVTDAKLEADALAEVAELRKRVSKLESYLRESETETANLMEDMAKAKEIINELQEERAGFQSRITSYYHLCQEFSSAANSSVFKRRHNLTIVEQKFKDFIKQ